MSGRRSATCDELRAMFGCRPDRIHLAGMLFASHPTPVREALEALRKQFDDDPVGVIEATLEHGFDDEVRRTPGSHPPCSTRRPNSTLYRPRSARCPGATAARRSSLQRTPSPR